MNLDSGWEDEVNKTISHPTRRKILDTLYVEHLSFTQLQNRFGNTENHGNLGYHLRALRQFIEQDSEKKYHLTHRGEQLTKVMREYRSQLSKVPNYRGYVKGFKAGDHAFSLYKNDEFRREVVLPFLEHNISKGYAGVYLISERHLDSDLEALRGRGLAADALPRDALTVVSAEEWYLRRGRADHDTILTNRCRLGRERESAGFAGMAICGEIGVLFEASRDVCVEYEEARGRYLGTGDVAMCLYSDKLQKESDFGRIIRSHGYIVSESYLGALP